MDEVTVEIKLTVAQVNVILNHLGRGVYNDVVGVIDLIRGQAVPQLASAQTPASSHEETEQLAS